MTGRKGRVVRRSDGSVHYESRAEHGHTIDHINIKEKDRFMKGEKLVAIISEAASSGISLQADRRVKNQRRRVHMTLELPWSADRAIQQFGRTHRSNQVTSPEYIFLISELAGERRFASIVAKRLESLGALTHGDRRATESRDLSKYNFENKYGNRALEKITKAILGHIESKVAPPKSYPGGDAMFFRDMKQGMMDVGIFCKEPRFGINPEKDCTISKFLNRILGLEVHKQNSLFQYFSDNFDYLIEKDKKEGKYDMGILDLAPGNDEISNETQERFLTPGNPQEGQVILYKISVDRGMPWEEALKKVQTLNDPDEGFYISHKMRGSHPCVLLAELGRGHNLTVYKPNVGKQKQPESLENIQKRYRKVTSEEAKESWENQFTFSLRKCSHANWNGRCKKVDEGQECLQGMRLRQYHVLCGALLCVWKRVADVVTDVTSSSILQIVRLKTREHKQVGIKIPENCVAQVRDELDRMDKEVKRRRQEKELKAQEQQLAEQRQRLLEEKLPALYSQPLQLSSITNLSPLYTGPIFTSFAQLSSSEDILDLTMPSSSRFSPHSTGPDLSVPVMDFNMEAFTQMEQQQHQQQQSQPILRDSTQQGLLNFFNSLPEPSQCHSGLPSASSDSLHTDLPAPTSLFSTSTIHPSSSSSSIFSPSLTPSSSSSSLSLFSSLSPSDQHPFVNCGDNTAINAKEVLSSMLSSDSRQSVIQFRVPESDHVSYTQPSM